MATKSELVRTRLRAFIGVCAAAVIAACASPPVETAPTAPVAAAPADSQSHGAWSASALADLRAAALTAEVEGLPSEARSVAKLDRLAGDDERIAAQRDAAADALFARLVSRFALGVAPPSVDKDWFIEAPTGPDVAAARARVASGEAPSAVLAAILPVHPQYAPLREALAKALAEAPGTQDANGLSREARIAKLRVAMQRLRWLPHELAPRRIEVRVAQQRLIYLDPAGSTEFHNVVVGTRRAQTPSIEDQVDSVTINPYWTPPPGIVRRELVPRLRRDPNGAFADGFVGVDAEGAEVDPLLIDWYTKPFPYTLRQRPGPKNALGRVRFDMPNAHNVYMHDTPSRQLFDRADRALSHGCVRVEDPLALAVRVLPNGWDMPSVEAAVDAGASQRVPLPAPIPVFFIYNTVVADETDGVLYLDDFYNRDVALNAALERADAEASGTPAAALLLEDVFSRAKSTLDGAMASIAGDKQSAERDDDIPPPR